MSDFHNLHVWHKSHALALEVYRATANFPGHELYGLTSQMRRASTSIPMNIAEGCGRGSRSEFVRLVTIAADSAKELEYQALLSHDLGLLSVSQYEQLTTETIEVARMLTALIRRTRGAIEVRSRVATTNYQLPTTN